MSNFNDEHPRDREGKFTDKPGTGPAVESDVDLPLPDAKNLRRRSDGRDEVDDTEEADRLYGCSKDDRCILADGHEGECDAEREFDIYNPGPLDITQGTTIRLYKNDRVEYMGPLKGAGNLAPGRYETYATKDGRPGDIRGTVHIERGRANFTPDPVPFHDPSGIIEATDEIKIEFVRGWDGPEYEGEYGDLLKRQPNLAKYLRADRSYLVTGYSRALDRPFSGDLWVVNGELVYSPDEF